MPPVVWNVPQTGLGFVFTIGISPRARGAKVGFKNAGAKAGAPCSLEKHQGFLDLQKISFAASAECGRTERPVHAVRLHESCECFLGSALREHPGERVVAVELPSRWQSGQASWPTRHGSPCGIHEPSKHVRVDTISRHTSVWSRKWSELEEVLTTAS